MTTATVTLPDHARASWQGFHGILDGPADVLDRDDDWNGYGPFAFVNQPNSLYQRDFTDLGIPRGVWVPAEWVA